mmetsp:Transcript_31480/g.47583  ORF Transcript_31480/g.47583 Transcript_31480/m.47583 type:complete len:420 (+) Transcript_31480:20-1279(+)
MKFFLLFSAFNYLSVHAVDNAKAVDLDNGAEVVLDIVNPPDNSSTFNLKRNEKEYSVPMEVTAQVSVGAPDVHYIYIMDTSGSTISDDGACGTTLQCVEELFYKIHHEIRGDESAKVVSFIEFDTDANTILERFSPDNPDVGLALVSQNHTSDGDTYCNQAFEQASQLAKPNEKTVVIFAGDGLCNDDPRATLESLEKEGVIVHSIAVGDAVTCDGTSGWYYYDFTLEDLTTNDGQCFDIPDPNDTKDIVHNITLAQLSGFEMKIDGGNYEDIPLVDLSVDKLPQDHPTVVSYSKELKLEWGEHDICFRATGQDASDEKKIEDCRHVYIQDMPTAAPSVTPSEMPSMLPSVSPTKRPLLPSTSVGGILGIAVAVIAVIVAVWYVVRCKRNSKESDTGDNEMSNHDDGKPDDVIEVGVPV